MNAVYTNAMSGNLAPDMICSVDGEDVVSVVENLNKSDEEEEDLHRREAAHAMLEMHSTPQSVASKSEQRKKFGDPVSTCVWYDIISVCAAKIPDPW